MRFAVLVALPALQEHARRLADFSSLRKGVGRDYTPFQKSAVCGAITCTLSPSKNSRFPPPVAEVGLVAHRCAGHIIVEGESLGGEAPPSRPAAQYDLDGFLARMETASSVPALLDIAAQETRRMIAFDRVMIYQFD